ncbi:MAG: hypothetical protein KBG29_01535 [Pseudomonadales bacterium]|nr:hypothetical protein [Pseudomonadales bacterium]
MSAQLAMHGDDWLSDRDRKTQARAEARRKAAALKCSRKLDEARDALNEFLSACLDCGHVEATRLDDSRRLLMRDMSEYSSYLDSVYNKERR